ncbi:MAG: N-acetyl-gamma-glutamyl-phosphate reductase [Clostridiales bacterium]|jgi:N-acetyl-gamma-glutamyl-phosphate reductase|nr:N-acetyl-gamma-glutamyl-phosphate reductase [Clostridiales bacterium]
MIKAGIIGATGYAGVELVRILLNHPFVELAAISSVSFEGKKISEIYPSLYGVYDETLSDGDTVIKKSDVVFASLPHGISQPLAKACLGAGKIFIDLGADFRLRDEDTYRKWYDGGFDDKTLHEKAVYGLPEIYAGSIKNAKLIANPGCYPTSAALALYPGLLMGVCEKTGIIIDSKSGATGAGRGLALNTHFAELNEGFSAYKAGVHRHSPEIEQTLSDIAGERISITFVPHLLPVNRGILTTVYAKNKGFSLSRIHEVYSDFYKDAAFVKVLNPGEYANIKNVRMTNMCHISLHLDEHTDTIIITSAIDNMVKGAAGQAVQNLNIVFGLPEDEGLKGTAPSF